MENIIFKKKTTKSLFAYTLSCDTRYTLQIIFFPIPVTRHLRSVSNIIFLVNSPSFDTNNRYDIDYGNLTNKYERGIKILSVFSKRACFTSQTGSGKIVNKHN